MFSKVLLRKKLAHGFVPSQKTAAAFSTSSSKPWGESKILVTGCQGQVGIPLVQNLVDELGAENVLATDASEQKVDLPCSFAKLDVVDADNFMKLAKDNNINYVVHLGAIISALGERNPDLAVDVNVTGTINAVRVAQETQSKLFVPSSIAAFGGDLFPKDGTPVETILQPKTIYGVSKVFNEMLGEYYKRKLGMDFRCIRYPVVVSSEKFAFNRSGCYTTEIFFHALENRHYKCWLAEDTRVPMIYIDDCVKATVQYLKADPARLQSHVYNLAGISASAGEFCAAVQQLIPELVVEFEPDFRQPIAASWPNSLDDKESKRDWDWSYDISTYELASRVLAGIDDKYKTSLKQQQ